MLIYHVGRISYLWRVLVHKFTYNYDVPALVLINVSGISDAALEFVKRMQGMEIRNVTFRTFKEGMFFNQSYTEIISIIGEYFDGLFSEIGCLPEGCTIYTSADKHNSFSTYLTMKECPFVMIDVNRESAHRVAHYHSYPPKHRDYVDVMNNYKALSSDNPCARSILSLTDVENVYDKDCEVCDSIRDLGALSAEKKGELFSMYSVGDYAVHSDEVLLLSSSIWRGSYQSSDLEFYRSFAAFADYYLPGEKVVMKPHPAADTSKWSLFFDRIVPGSIPSQFLEESGNCNPKAMYFTKTSGGRIGNSSVDLSVDYLNNYRINDRLFFLISQLCEYVDPVITTSLAVSRYAGIFLDMVRPDRKGMKACDVIVADGQSVGTLLKRQKADEIIVDVDSSGYALFTKRTARYWDRLVLMRLDMSKQREDGLATHGGFIFIYVVDDELRNSLRSYSSSKVLPRCREDCSYAAVSCNDLYPLMREHMSKFDAVLSSKQYASMFSQMDIRDIHEFLLYCPSVTQEARDIAVDSILSRDPFNPMYSPRSESDPLYHVWCGYCARCYRDGKTVKTDLAEAIRLMEIAACSGKEWTRVELAEMYYRSGDSSKMEQAYTLLEAFGEDAGPDVIGCLGRFYMNKDDSKYDPDKGMSFLRNAAASSKKWLPVLKQYEVVENQADR